MNYSNGHLMSEMIEGDLHKVENILICINELLAREFFQIVGGNFHGPESKAERPTGYLGE